MKLVIERKTWARGATRGDYLKNPSGTKCCLGFLGEACGLSEQELRNHGTLQAVVEFRKITPNRYLYEMTNRDPHSQAIRINDTRQLSEEERETELILIFAGAGIQLSFVDEYPHE